MSNIYNNSIFWVDVGKVSPNPFQPRREFNEEKLKALSDSIKQYGILQPLIVSRKEEEKEDGGISALYELIAGERRLRASKLAGLQQVPVIIREGGEDDGQLKLELAIIENIQREDLNPVDRAFAFKQLIDKFGFKHIEVAKKVGKSREYVSNSVRLLSLPEEILEGITKGKITEGHARPLMMLVDNPEEQVTLFKDIVFKKLTVREAERIARHTAHDKIRKRSSNFDPEILALEERLTRELGTRVQIERSTVGGKITIDFISSDDLNNILELLERREGDILPQPKSVLENQNDIEKSMDSEESVQSSDFGKVGWGVGNSNNEENKSDDIETDKNIDEKNEGDDLYSIKNFSI